MLKEVSVLPSPTAIQPQMVAKRVASIKTEKAYLKKRKTLDRQEKSQVQHLGNHLFSGRLC